ncbi:MAG: hypothetical protein JNL01_13490 [Bdellovibrionales bacterium]|nr:hypothetical protein [Bdellovibrionales bacterium]
MKKPVVSLFVGVSLAVSQLALAQVEKKVADQTFRAEGKTEEEVVASLKNQVDQFVGQYKDPKYSISVSYQDAANDPTTTTVNGKQIGEKKVGGNRKLKLFARPVVIIDKCRGNKWQFPLAARLQGVKRHRVPIYEKVKKTTDHWSAEAHVLVGEIEQPKQQDIVQFRKVVIDEKAKGGGVYRKPASGGSSKKPGASAHKPSGGGKGASGGTHTEYYELIVNGQVKRVSKDQIPANAVEIK